MNYEDSDTPEIIRKPRHIAQRHRADEIYARLIDIIESSNADDALELIQFCKNARDTKMTSYIQNAEERRKIMTDSIQQDKECLLEVLKEDTYIPYSQLLTILSKKYPYKGWDWRTVRFAISELTKENKIEKKHFMKWIDPDTLKQISGTGFRRIS